MMPASVLALAAAAANDPPDLLAQLLGYGIPGLAIAMIVFRVLVPYWVVTRQDAAHDAEIAAKDQVIAAKDAEIIALRAKLDQAENFVRAEVVPALVRTAEISREYVAALNRRANAS